MSPARNDDDELEDDAVATATDDAGDDVDGEDPAGDEAAGEGGPEYKLSLSVDVQDNGPCRKHVKITIPRADIEHFYEEEIGDLSEQAAVPGFRKGRVPQELVKKRFKKELADQVKQKLLLQSLEQVSKDHKIDPINEPDLDVLGLEIPDDGDFEYEFDVEVRPDFDLPDYAGLQIQRPIRDFSDADVQKAVNRFLEQSGRLEDKDGPAERGDWIDVSGEFSFKGRPIGRFGRRMIQVQPKLQFQDAELSGFDTLMAGANAGDTRAADVTVSTEASEVELRGEQVHADLTVHAVKVRKLPELTSGFLAMIGAESEDDLKQQMKNVLERQLKYEQRQSARRQVQDQITASADWDLPEETVRRQVENAMRREILEMQQAGFTPQEIRSREATLRQQAVSTTRRALKEHFVLDKIATKENIQVEDSDMEIEIRAMAQQMGESPRRVRARLNRTGVIENLFAQIRERKAIDVILDQAQYNDVPTPVAHDEGVEGVPISVCGSTAEPVAGEEDEGDEE